MTTTTFQITPADGWVEVADVTDFDVFLENISNYTAGLAYAASTPSAADHHPVPGKSLTLRLAPGKIFAKAVGKDTVTLVVSK